MGHCDVNSQIVFIYFVVIGILNFIQGSYAACNCKTDADCFDIVDCPPSAEPICQLCLCACLHGKKWRNEYTLGTNKPTNTIVGQNQQQTPLQVKT